MNLLSRINVFKKTKSADIARHRLRIIIEQEKSDRGSPDYLPKLRQDILKLVEQYTQTNLDAIQIELHRQENNSVLELNVTLPD